MLYFVLLLVAAALAGVVAALITANSLWAWISIGLSVLAGLILLIDWFRRRPGGRSTAAEPAPAEPESESDSEQEAETYDSDDTESADQSTAAEHAESEAEPAEQTAEDVTASDSEAESATESGEPAAASVPGEEQTDAADTLIIADLDAEVLVVDEYPRYHLSECGWLADRQTIPISVSEARELGFSPCARCGPDAALATKHRKSRKKFRTRAD